MAPRLDRFDSYQKQCDRALRWASEECQALKAAASAGNLVDGERHFLTASQHLNTALESMVAAGNCCDQASWSRDLEAEVAQDLLLNYLHEARNATSHRDYVEWRDEFTVTDLRIADIGLAIQFAMPYPLMSLQHLQLLRTAVMSVMWIPTDDEDRKRLRSTMALRAALCGFGFGPLGLTPALRQFEVPDRRNQTVRIVPEPTFHQGRTHPNGAIPAIESALKFYTAKFAELIKLPALQNPEAE